MRSVHQGLTIYECEEAFSPQQKKSKIKSKSTKDSGGKKKTNNANENSKEALSNDFHIAWIETSPVVRT